MEREGLTAQLADLQEQLAALSAGRQEAAKPEARDAVHDVVMRLLQTPRSHPYHELPLAPEIDMPVGDDAEGRTAASLAGFTFPAGFDPVRAEKEGEEAVAVGLSQDYDPVGEISRGAYWVLRSHDGGRTWGAPLYSGLRLQQPYVILPLS